TAPRLPRLHQSERDGLDLLALHDARVRQTGFHGHLYPAAVAQGSRPGPGCRAALRSPHAARLVHARCRADADRARAERAGLRAGLAAKPAHGGQTLLGPSAAQAYKPPIYASLPYDTSKDFIDVVPLGGQPNVLVVAPAAGFKNVADLIAQAKQKPGQLNFGSAGQGSATHINGEKFKLAAGIDVVHIPYKGTPEALTDTIAGRIT